MIKFYNMKKVLLAIAALFACNVSFAQQTETQATAKGADKNIDAVGISYTLPGTYIAGKGSSMTGTMTSKGLKLRTKQDGGKIVFNVNPNYTIVKLVIDAVGNYAADDASIHYVTVTDVTVDGATASFEGGEFPQKGSTESGILTIDNIKATQQIEIFLNNDNASAGTQINACYEVTYEEADAAEPTITISPESLNLIPGASYQLDYTIVPGTFKESCLWYAGTIEDFMNAGGVSPENEIIELGENGLITAKGPGTIPVSLTWIENLGVVEGKTTVTVHDFKAAEHKIAQSYDFTTMGDVQLAIGGESFQIWNDANNQCNGVRFCTNEGLEKLAFQAVINDNSQKGYQLIEGEGLYLKSAGRCGAVGGLKKGQYVEFIYTGSIFASKDYTMDLKLGPDAGATKTIINDVVGHTIFQVQDKNGETEDLMVGFEIGAGNYIKSITVYEEAADPSAIQSIETNRNEDSAVYNLMGIKVSDNAKGLLIKNGKKYIVK